MYQKDQRVKVKYHNKIVPAIILQDAYTDMMCMWWVKLVNTEDVLVFEESDLDYWNRNVVCECGSDSLGYEPVRHSEWCDKFELS